MHSSVYRIFLILESELTTCLRGHLELRDDYFIRSLISIQLNNLFKWNFIKWYKTKTMLVLLLLTDGQLLLPLISCYRCQHMTSICHIQLKSETILTRWTIICTSTYFTVLNKRLMTQHLLLQNTLQASMSLIASLAMNLYDFFYSLFVFVSYNHVVMSGYEIGNPNNPTTEKWNALW